MDQDTLRLARSIELHEAEAWASCIDAVAALDENPLGAEVDRSTATPLSTLTAFNFERFNRVIALGVEAPAREEDLDAIMAFYSERSQSRYAIEVTPVTEPPSFQQVLRLHGFRPNTERVAKLVRQTDEIPESPKGIDVRLLDEDDRLQVSAVNLAAWGVPSFLSSWFSATVGWEGFRHYGVFVGKTLASTVAMYVSSGIAWTGFGATHPDFQGRGFQTARIVREIRDAAELGCTVMHNETATGTPDSPNMSLRNLSKMGFERIYDKELFVPG